jgi:Zn finger protein HypA/HybF involved in hydrogenase expression
MAGMKVKMECMECGKKFSISMNNPDPSCPKCHGVDVDVAELELSNGRFISLPLKPEAM